MKRRIALLTAALLLLSLAVPAVLAEEAAAPKAYYVCTDNGRSLNARSSPAGEIIGTLENGTKVELLDNTGKTWVQVGLEDGRTAWVNRRYLTDITPEELNALIAEEEESVSGDPITDINAEFAAAQRVEPYRVTVRPPRVTSWVNMRWIPSETGRIIEQYKAPEELVVLKELKYYVQVQDPDTGDVGYVHKRFIAK